MHRLASEPHDPRPRLRPPPPSALGSTLQAHYRPGTHPHGPEMKLPAPDQLCSLHFPAGFPDFPLPTAPAPTCRPSLRSSFPESRPASSGPQAKTSSSPGNSSQQELSWAWALKRGMAGDLPPAPTQKACRERGGPGLLLCVPQPWDGSRGWYEDSSQKEAPMIPSS